MNDQASEKQPAQEPAWSMLEWRASIPLCDDVWLGMQAQNIAIVDRIVRHFERVALDGFYENDRFSMDDLLPLSAMSQVWVFALYEFLRTWVQRASKLIRYSERLASMKTEGERADVMKQFEAETQERAKHIKLAPFFYADHVARIVDTDFIRSIREYRDSIKQLFQDAEAIRVPLAKHEIGGAKAEGLMAEAPGYGRVNLMTGSMYWQIVLADGGVDVIDRHSLADRFFGTEKPKEESALFADDEVGEAEGSADRGQAEPSTPAATTIEELPLSDEERNYLSWFFGKPGGKAPRRHRGRRGGRRNRKPIK
jgi:hypothetical protein